MTTRYYDFFDDLLVAVSGDSSRTATQYRKMYDHFRVASPDRDPDVVIEETTDDADPDIVLGNPDEYYGWTGEAFVVGNSYNHMAIRPGWDHVQVTPSREPFSIIYPMEFALRRRTVEREKALMHASALRIDGKTTLFPAYRAAGKTNTLLSLLREGADFLSDDRLWVGADGSAVGYPLGVNLQPHNVDSFPEIEETHETWQEQVRHDLHEFIDERFDRSGPLPETAVAYLNDTYLEDSGRDFADVQSLFPDAEYVSEASVDNVVFLEAAPNARTISLEPLPTERAVALATAISNFEWDGQLREYFHAYDALVEGGDMVETFERVVRRERAVFRQLFADVPTYRAFVPRERDWGKHGLDAAMADIVTSIDTREVIEASD